MTMSEVFERVTFVGDPNRYCKAERGLIVVDASLRENPDHVASLLYRAVLLQRCGRIVESEPDLFRAYYALPRNEPV